MRRPTLDDPVARAMREVPRAAFLPQDQRPHAAEDRPLPLWHGQTSSQPSTVAAMLRLLDVPPGVRVLDVGAGSGWTTALLAHLVGAAGDVVGVELDPELAVWGAGNVATAGRAWARVLAATAGELGRPDDGPFDRILVSAEAQTLPAALVDQLVPAGRLVIPVARTMLLVVRPADGGEPHVTTHGSYRFVPLR